MSDSGREPTGGELRLVCFQVGEQRFGAPIHQVKETIVLRPITRVFLVPRFVAGLVNLRGEVVAAIDLGLFLGLAPVRRGPETRILIARAGGRTAGLLVDRVAEVRSVDEGTLQPATDVLGGDFGRALRGVATVEGGAPIGVLDLGQILQSERFAPFRRKA